MIEEQSHSTKTTGEHSQLTPLKAVRAKCIDCSGGFPGEVRKCGFDCCPLFEYRFGAKPAKTASAAAPEAHKQAFAKEDVAVAPAELIEQTPAEEPEAVESTEDAPSLAPSDQDLTPPPTTLKAIKAFCLECCGGDRTEVKLCPAAECPLHHIRLGKTPKNSRQFSQETLTGMKVRAEQNFSRNLD